MLCLEWWAFELLTLGSAYFGVVPQAVTVLSIHIMSIMYMIQLGFRQGVQMYVGKSIGENNVSLAKEYMDVSNKLAALLICSCSVFFYLCSKQIVSLFTTNTEIYDLFISILPLSYLAILGDNL